MALSKSKIIFVIVMLMYHTVILDANNQIEKGENVTSDIQGFNERHFMTWYCLLLCLERTQTRKVMFYRLRANHWQCSAKVGIFTVYLTRFQLKTSVERLRSLPFLLLMKSFIGENVFLQVIKGSHLPFLNHFSPLPFKKLQPCLLKNCKRTFPLFFFVFFVTLEFVYLNYSAFLTS